MATNDVDNMHLPISSILHHCRVRKAATQASTDSQTSNL
eukprot:CAMPEP_0169418428 /NCGR_PEP_ID=MMETSP1017-20121227/64299_1 /TAXON_ID=342587 /ORGANISM="Karlodinium micrum, Strain CCMP2283" /LENGTH=38 /DNA_ID= /DNA_START= /DNA_END= /DNA_ORIENTATION=